MRSVKVDWTSSFKCIKMAELLTQAIRDVKRETARNAQRRLNVAARETSK